MAGISLTGTGKVPEISALIKQRLTTAERSCFPMESMERENRSLLIFGAKFFRAGDCTLSIMLSGEGESVHIDAVATIPMTDIFSLAQSAESEMCDMLFEAVRDLGFELVERRERPDYSIQVEEMFTKPASELESLEEIMRSGMEAKRGKGAAKNAAEVEKDNHAGYERVTLGREEKKGLFGKRGSKPDWEY